MCFRCKKIIYKINSKYTLKDFVDFKYKNDVYFGKISKIYFAENFIHYDIDIAGQCPTTVKGIPEKDIFRIHK